ncbi:MAG TPA: NADH-ubiquinone oxidoreductase-F iron-sulfur binding region domain-containing protein [Acidimicrobiia bacterium]|nr:NADH-ubiquinone oxidoreductase-F iron-sulfur binding region domain-containing protein [Acidimicrobiia bacterium]
MRVLDPEPIPDLDDYLRAGGGAGLEAARRLGAAGTIDEVEASGLRGRGGAGFPTGVKWRTVAGLATLEEPRTVVVNGAEGEPGTFKDRAILRTNPYRVLEGALVAALAVGGADRIVVALKASFLPEIERVRRAIGEVERAGWTEGVVDFEVLEGPEHYLFGEETGLLEVLSGRPPFPRIAPPYRHGADEVGEGGASAADVEMAHVGHDAVAPPTLVNNVETLANVAGVLAHGASWFRTLGTDQSPGTVVCTVTGDTVRAGVGEFPMGTRLRDVIETVGGGTPDGHRVAAVLPGVANALVPASHLDVPVTYEDFRAMGSGVGSAGFIVFDETSDFVAVAHGVSRFLAVESCGQCTPCKQDGLAILEHLDRARDSRAADVDEGAVLQRLGTITEGARCSLAQQHHDVVESVLRLFPDALQLHIDGDIGPAAPVLIAPLADIEDGVAIPEDRHAEKQADWTYDERWSGQAPVDRLETRV